jgi:hypothetical protein
MNMANGERGLALVEGREVVGKGVGGKIRYK